VSVGKHTPDTVAQRVSFVVDEAAPVGDLLPALTRLLIRLAEWDEREQMCLSTSLATSPAQGSNRKPGISARRFQGSADADSGIVHRKLTKSKRPRTRSRRS
jgi:hypothetical protein